MDYRVSFLLPVFISILWYLSSLRIQTPEKPANSHVSNHTQAYVVYLGGREEEVEEEIIVLSHHQMLSSVLGSHEAARECILYSYTHAFNVFSVVLEPQQALAISRKLLLTALHLVVGNNEQLAEIRYEARCSSSHGEGKPTTPIASVQDWEKRETKAKVLLRMSVKDTIIPHIRDCKTSTDTWEVLKVSLFLVALVCRRKTTSNSTHRYSYIVFVELPGVISVFPSRPHSLHTTRSWGFLGLEDPNSGDIPPDSLWKKANFWNDVIIGNLDTGLLGSESCKIVNVQYRVLACRTDFVDILPGVWPESASFNDSGMDPVPSRWRVICQNGTRFGPQNCNRKLIGAKYFIEGYERAHGSLNETATGDFPSPRDSDGHGTHTLSTAGGRFVRGANMFGFAEGTAKGGSPNGRVASYKVCWPGRCYGNDILAAFDAAISDGVDVLSISIGAPVREYIEDPIAIGAFHAVRRGIIVVCAAGNEGPGPGSVKNVAQWIKTVAASSIDREFPSWVMLGNNMTFRGQSLSEFRLPNPSFYPLISSLYAKAPNARQAAGGALDPDLVRGKIVACLYGIISPAVKGDVVRLAGGAGMILYDIPGDVNFPQAFPHVLPTSQLRADDGDRVFSYINWTDFPVAYISPATTELNVTPAPLMAPFSSQGPNPLTAHILKPDITAPGLNILAAFPAETSPTELPSDLRRTQFNIQSGTSMSCPHVAGIAALLKALHPSWSPAAIQSAIMTTANTMDNTIRDTSLKNATPLSFGSGHVNPNAAADPGLVYDRSEDDYIMFLCSLNYSSKQIEIITTRKNVSCPWNPPEAYDLNYPSITVSNLAGVQVVKRSVTNVGVKGVYSVRVKSPPGVQTKIEPTELQFSAVGEKRSFTVELKAMQISEGNFVYGELTWSDGQHSVRSPIVVNATTCEESTMLIDS
eukprot:Gb_20614 [translate_table: standard]